MSVDALKAQLLSQLECPVCFETCVPPIYMCYNGHSVCADCQSQLDSCGECRTPGKPTLRCVKLEKISELVKPPSASQSHRKPLGHVGNIPSFSWVRCQNGDTGGENAVRGGVDKDGSALFVGRCFFNGDLLPAKVNSVTHQCAFVPYGCAEHRINTYEVLHSQRPMSWVAASEGKVPSGALATGWTDTNEPLYTCRVRHDGTLTLGKVHGSHGTAYISYNGTEIAYKHYEVLVVA